MHPCRIDHGELLKQSVSICVPYRSVPMAHHELLVVPLPVSHITLRCALFLVIGLSSLCGSFQCHLSIHGELVDCVGGPKFSQTMSPETGYFQKLATTGREHACAIRHRTGRVVCWNTTGSVGEETNVPDFVVKARSISLGMHHSCAIWGSKNTLTCWGSDTLITTVSPVNVSHGVRMLTVGHPTSRHTCFLRASSGDVSCFGSNTFGQLGLGTFGVDIVSVPVQKIRPD
jgi:hypothetical protein